MKKDADIQDYFSKSVLFPNFSISTERIPSSDIRTNHFLVSRFLWFSYILFCFFEKNLFWLLEFICKIYHKKICALDLYLHGQLQIVKVCKLKN